MNGTVTHKRFLGNNCCFEQSFYGKMSLVVPDVSYIVFTLPMPPFGPVPFRDSSLT